MAKYALRQLLITIPVLAGISLVLFTIIAMAPGDPFEELATNPNVPPEVRMNLRVKFGLDDPLPIRYARWMGAMVRGDWGFSFVSRVNVDTLILQRLPTSMLVVGSAQILAVLIALPIGTYSALRPYSFFDQAATTIAFIGFSLPTFFTGLVFILVFSISLDWLPFIYRADISATGWRWYWEHLRQALMPVAVLGLFQGAALTRFMRSAVLDVVRLDFVAIITEQIFRVPGIGSLLISSILANDTPVVMAITFVLSALIVLSNLVADLLYGWLDPRISYR